MHTLDNLKKIKQLDKSDMLGSIDLFHKQVGQAIEETKNIKIPADYKKIDKVVINGMGGSGLGTHIIRSIYFKKLKHTIDNIHSYDLPGVVDKKTLFILSSYSGNTEEILQTFGPAKARSAKLLGIAADGKLGEMIKSGKIPGYKFEPRYNLCNQPRIGVCYSVTGLLGLLKRIGVIKVKNYELEAAAKHMKKLVSKFSAKKPFSQNPAKQIADKMRNKTSNVIASGFLSGNAHVLANQINENAKTFSNYFIISELNHHLLEGLKFPNNNSKNLHFFFFESDLYHPRNQKRYVITKDILNKFKISHSSYHLIGKTELEQSFEALLFGTYVAFYLAILNTIDPSSIPWVDYFKNELEKI